MPTKSNSNPNGISTLRPGILVSLKTSIKGNIEYRKTDTAETQLKSGAAVATWETTRKIEDPEEFEKAKTLRSAARANIAKVCAATTFGLLCPEADLDKLQQAIEQSRKDIDVFNQSASLTKVSIYALCGRVAPDDVEAIRAIHAEVRDLLDDMKSGINGLDAQKVREAANRVRSIGQMLTPDAQERISVAVAAARKTARQIVKAAKEIAEAGDTAATEIDRSSLEALKTARVAFLDFEDDVKEVATPKSDARTVDLAPTEVVAVRRPRNRARQAEV